LDHNTVCTWAFTDFDHRDLIMPEENPISDNPVKALENAKGTQDSFSYSTTPPNDTANPTPPQQDSLLLSAGASPVAGYVLVKLLGKGGFGEVWNATGPGGFSVALKFIRLGGEAARVELRSLEVMKSIRHGHLLHMSGAWQVGDYLIIAMELADCTLLDQLNAARKQDEKGIPPAELIEYMRDAAKGIDYLNERHHLTPSGNPVAIQHKDIKPQNLLVVGGTVKVADFGLARVLQHTVTMATGNMTPAYAPPEFFEDKVTRWSDQYSLAVTYCQLRGGQLPFTGSALQIMAGHASRVPDLSMIPGPERAPVARALSKKPEERWPDCRAFVEALADTRKDRDLVPIWRRRGKAILIGSGFCFVAAVVAFILWACAPEGHHASIESESSAKVAGAPAPVLELMPISPVKLVRGRNASVRVQVKRVNCPGPLDIDVFGLPDDVKYPPLKLPDGQDAAELEFYASREAAAGEWTLTIAANCGKERVEREATLSVITEDVIVDSFPPALQLRLSPAPVSLKAGKAVEFVVRVERFFCSGPVDLVFRELPPKVTVAPARIEGSRDEVTCTLTAGLDAAPGEMRFEVCAYCKSAKTEQVVKLEILKPSGLVTAETVLDQAIQALGGEEKLKANKYAIWSFKATALCPDPDPELVVFEGEIRFEVCTERRSKRLSVNFQESINREIGVGTWRWMSERVLAADKGWTIWRDVFNGDLDKNGVTSVKREAFLKILPITPVWLKDKSFKVELAQDEMADKSASALKITDPDGKNFTLFFDKHTHLPTKMIARDAGSIQETTFSDYKDFKGIKKAMKMETASNGKKQYSYETTDFKMSPDRGPNEFVKPD
jgi:serine/threonine protein kinase